MHGPEGRGSSLTNAGNSTVSAELLLLVHMLCQPQLLLSKWHSQGLVWSFQHWYAAGATPLLIWQLGPGPLSLTASYTPAQHVGSGCHVARSGAWV